MYSVSLPVQCEVLQGQFSLQVINGVFIASQEDHIFGLYCVFIKWGH